MNAKYQDSLDQYPLPINADQNPGIDPKNLSMQIICRSIPVNYDQLIGIDRNWSVPISIGINGTNLVGIYQHWSTLGND